MSHISDASPFISNSATKGQSLARKRKRLAPSQLTEDARQSIFAIKPRLSLSAPHDNEPAQQYETLCIIPRSQLPLTFIDTSSEFSRFFSARFTQLDDWTQHHISDGPLVLITRIEGHSNGALHAVERVRNDVYAFCRLASWVTLDHVKSLGSLPVAKACDLLQKHWANPSSNKAWWDEMILPKPDDTTPMPSLPARKAPRLSLSCPYPSAPDTYLSETKDTRDSHIALDATEEFDLEPASTEEAFSRFVSQYLDTLYLYKTPLAFFAKGPVSRLRAAFTAGRADCGNTKELVGCLRSIIQSSSSADKKYRDKLSGLVKEISARRDEESPVKDKRRRKSKNRKLKLDKYGMLPDEHDHFEKWWLADEAFTPVDETVEQCLKRRSVHLRLRETFMQIIIILEVLSLEATPEFTAAPIVTNDDLQHQADESQQILKDTKSKQKKASDLSVALELLLDKLCIWRSLDTDPLFEDIKRNSSDAAKDSVNDLPDFCVEVIIPFYMSRIPDQACNVNKKLGGPSPPTNKPKSSRKPGEPEHRHRPEKKPRRPLHRVATESAGAAAAGKATPSLRHCNTDSQLQNLIKRERSETPSLSSLPPYRHDSQTPHTTSQSRRGSSVINHLKSREVDFAALSAANEAKAKKRAEIEKKLRDAIGAIKKPNRVAAGRETMDFAEQRMSMTNGKAGSLSSNRSLTSNRKILNDREKVHVAATPKHGHRSQDMVAATPHHPPIPAPSFLRDDIYQNFQPQSASGPHVIPSSTRRPTSHLFPNDDKRYVIKEVEEDAVVPGTGHRQRTVRYEIEETPSKAKYAVADTDSRAAVVTMRKMPPLGGIEDEDDEDAVDLHLPTFQTPSKPSRMFFMADTPSKPASLPATDERGNGGSAPAIVASTPVKAAALYPLAPGAGRADDTAPGVAGKERSADVLPANVEKVETEGASLYQALGWDDDFSD